MKKPSSEGFFCIRTIVGLTRLTLGMFRVNYSYKYMSGIHAELKAFTSLRLTDYFLSHVSYGAPLRPLSRWCGWWFLCTVDL